MSLPTATPSYRWRWLVIGVFVISSALNYLDRQILAQLAPVLKQDLSLSDSQYGWLLSAFAACYAVSAPWAGWLLDRLGLTRGMSAAVGFWSLAGMATGLSTGFWSLVACRSALAVGEAAGVPGSAKANRLYLPSPEYALGSAAGQVGLTVGGVIAPPLATYFALQGNWRYAFIVAGALGFLWIPLWRSVARSLPPLEAEDKQTGDAAGSAREVLKDVRMWGLFVANILCMGIYSLWGNWTTLFLTDFLKMPFAQTAGYASLPPLFLTAGGLFGGFLAMRMVRDPQRAFRSRMQICWGSAVLVLLNAAAPFAASPWLAMAAICAACFFTVAISVNLYSMPLDFFAPRTVAFAVSLLTAAYGVLQFGISPLIGWTLENLPRGFETVCLMVAPLSLAACAVMEIAHAWYRKGSRAVAPGNGGAA